jgi:hypothetical protein
LKSKRGQQCRDSESGQSNTGEKITRFPVRCCQLNRS